MKIFGRFTNSETPAPARDEENVIELVEHTPPADLGRSSAASVSPTSYAHMAGVGVFPQAKSNPGPSSAPPPSPPPSTASPDDIVYVPTYSHEGSPAPFRRSKARLANSTASAAVATTWCRPRCTAAVAIPFGFVTAVSTAMGITIFFTQDTQINMMVALCVSTAYLCAVLAYTVGRRLQVAYSRSPWCATFWYVTFFPFNFCVANAEIVNSNATTALATDSVVPDPHIV